jgi:predicted phage tail protein
LEVALDNMKKQAELDYLTLQSQIEAFENEKKIKLNEVKEEISKFKTQMQGFFEQLNDAETKVKSLTQQENLLDQEHKDARMERFQLVSSQKPNQVIQFFQSNIAQFECDVIGLVYYVSVKEKK